MYRRPIKNSNPPKFAKQQVGHNTLSTIVKSIFARKVGLHTILEQHFKIS